MKAMIETVLGPVAVDELGVVFPHEHFPLVWGDYRMEAEEETERLPEGYRERFYDWEREVLTEAAGCGMKTLVEVTPIGLHRDLKMMRALSRECGVHVVASTGFYLREKMPVWVEGRSVEELAAYMLRELTQGIGDSGVRPWMIKVAAAGEPREQEVKVFRAAALASRQTGAAITTHSCNGVRRHFDLLVEAGADPARLYIGHADLVGDEEEYYHVARNGGHLIFTCWGIRHFVDQELLAGRVAGLAAAHPDAVLLSIDYALAYSTDRMVIVSYEYECPRRMPSFLFRYALPKLREHGMGDEQFHRMLVENPREMLIRR